MPAPDIYRLMGGSPDWHENRLEAEVLDVRRGVYAHHVALYYAAGWRRACMIFEQRHQITAQRCVVTRVAMLRRPRRPVSWRDFMTLAQWTRRIVP